MGRPPAIRAEGLSKKYLLGQPGAGQQGLRHLIEDSLRSLVGRGKGSRPTGSPREFWAVRGVSFEIPKGEVVGIIGRNGAGKSTLLKLLSRITEPSEGRIGINGRIASLLEVGTGFHPELTGRENIFLNGAILGMSQAEIRGKFEEIVEFAEVGEFLDTPVKRYSSGMYVRLAFSVAAHLEPEILVIDEVLAVGDAQFQQKCLGKMRDVSSRDGRTVLFVSHAMHTVRALCSTGILLDRGRIEAMGPVADVIAAYSRPVEGAGDLAANRALGLSLKAVALRQEDSEGGLLVEAHFHLEHAIPHAGLGVHVETASGLEICDLRPETSGLHFGTRQGDLRIAFALPTLSRILAAGTYRLGLSFHETNWRRCLERTPVGEFVVPATDSYGTGYPPKCDKDGPCVLPVQLLRAG